MAKIFQNLIENINLEIQNSQNYFVVKFLETIKEILERIHRKVTPYVQSHHEHGSDSFIRTNED